MSLNPAHARWTWYHITLYVTVTCGRPVGISRYSGFLLQYNCNSVKHHIPPSIFIYLVVRPSAVVNRCLFKQSCVIRLVISLLTQSLNSNQPLWSAVIYIVTFIFWPGLYFLVIMPFAYIPPASLRNGPWYGSPHTPHFPPFAAKF